MLWRLVRVSITGILQFLISQASWIGLVRIVSLFGAPALAAYTIGIRIVIFAILPSWGLSNAAATLVGPEPRRGPSRPRTQSSLSNRLMEHALPGHGGDCLYRLCAHGSSACLRRIRPWFAPAIHCLRIFSCGNVAFAYGMVMLQAFNGAGDTLTPTYVNLFGFWILEIPLAWWLAMHTAMRVNGVFVSVVVAQSVIVLISIVLFRQGRWATQRI